MPLLTQPLIVGRARPSTTHEEHRMNDYALTYLLAERARRMHDDSERHHAVPARRTGRERRSDAEPRSRHDLMQFLARVREAWVSVPPALRD
jgi:hypothetical protein